MSSNFGQIPLLTTELAALEGLRNQCHHFYSIAIGQIHLKRKHAYYLGRVLILARSDN